MIRVDACGVCSSDVKALHGAARYWGGEGQPKFMREPVIPGHEFIGHIVDVGDGITGWKIGDRVIPEQIVPCGTCRFCRDGEYWMCQRHFIYGFQAEVHGGMAEYLRIPSESLPYLHAVPEDLPLEAAVLIEPFACALHTVVRANIQIGDVVVVAGAGPLGLGMIAPIRRRGAKTLVVMDLKTERLGVARRFGADVVVNPAKDDASRIIEDLTHGYGCDVYIDAAASGSSVTQGLNLLRKRGTFVEMSVFGNAVSADWSIIGDSKELTILGSHLGPHAYPTVIDGLAAGWLPYDGVVTSVLPLAEFRSGFNLMATGENGSIKVVLQP